MINEKRTRAYTSRELPLERSGTLTLLLLWSLAIVGEKLLAFRRKSA